MNKTYLASVCVLTGTAVLHSTSQTLRLWSTSTGTSGRPRTTSLLLQPLGPFPTPVPHEASSTTPSTSSWTCFTACAACQGSVCPSTIHYTAPSASSCQQLSMWWIRQTCRDSEMPTSFVALSLPTPQSNTSNSIAGPEFHLPTSCWKEWRGCCISSTWKATLMECPFSSHQC